MSPNYVMQPRAAVVVPQEAWYAAPAVAPQEPPNSLNTSIMQLCNALRPSGSFVAGNKRTCSSYAPNYVMQPRAAVVVPQEAWYAAPAVAPQEPEK
jgi:hypothetical protein